MTRVGLADEPQNGTSRWIRWSGPFDSRGVFVPRVSSKRKEVSAYEFLETPSGLLPEVPEKESKRSTTCISVLQKSAGLLLEEFLET